MRIDMPKKAKKKSKGVVYSHEEIKKKQQNWKVI